VEFVTTREKTYSIMTEESYQQGGR